MQALFSEWTLFTWLVGFSKGSKPLCVRCTLTFLSSGMVSRGLMTESVPWQLRVDIFVTHICQKEEGGDGGWERGIKVSIRGEKGKNPSAITSVHPKKLTVPPPSRSCLFFISLSAGVSSLPVEPRCYLSARMRVCFIFISLFSDQKQPQPLSARLHTNTHARTHTHRRQFLLLLRCDVHTIRPYLWHTSTRHYNCPDRCYRLSPTSPSGTILHTLRPFSYTKLAYQLPPALRTVYAGHKRRRWHDMFCHDSPQIKYLRPGSPAGRTSNYSDTHGGVILQLCGVTWVRFHWTHRNFSHYRSLG